MDKQIAQEGIDTYINTEFPLTVFKSWDVVMGFFNDVEQKTDEESQEQYDKLPSVVKVYRGVLAKDGLKGSVGVSWTTDRKVAEMFALRLKPTGGEPYVREGEVDTEDRQYFTNAREESEVVLKPDERVWTEVEEEE